MTTWPPRCDRRELNDSSKPPGLHCGSPVSFSQRMGRKAVSSVKKKKKTDLSRNRFLFHDIHPLRVYNSMIFLVYSQSGVTITAIQI